MEIPAAKVSPKFPLGASSRNKIHTCPASKNQPNAGRKSAASIDNPRNSICPPKTLLGPKESQKANIARPKKIRAWRPTTEPSRLLPPSASAKMKNVTNPM